MSDTTQDPWATAPVDPSAAPAADAANSAAPAGDAWSSTPPPATHDAASQAAQGSDWLNSAPVSAGALQPAGSVPQDLDTL